MKSEYILLPRNSNQASGLANFALDFLWRSPQEISPEVLARTSMFFTDAFLTGISAIALGTNSPTVLRREAINKYALPPTAAGATIYGSKTKVHTVKAIVANSAADREWDSNGTNFGYNPALGHVAGEFGHNDYYPVVIAACQELGFDGKVAVRACVLLDEIRDRLASVFSLKKYKIDHVVHGAIASVAVYGALHRATAEQIERGIGMFVAHHIPWRAIRAGEHLSDSKGASAAISSEAAILGMQRCMDGFLGPQDIFRNPEAIFRFFEPTTQGKDRWKELADSPFDLRLTCSGSDFAIMGMHFKLGLYEHQSAGALQGLIDLLLKNPSLAESEEDILSIEISAYEPAFGIIGNPKKLDPKNRQSADHSMAYIVATLLRKAMELAASSTLPRTNDDMWKTLMLSPFDYTEDEKAIFNPRTRRLMSLISFRHNPEYDEHYPDGIPTSIKITTRSGSANDSGLVMYPAGHARNNVADLEGILRRKFQLLGDLALSEPTLKVEKLLHLGEMSSAEVANIHNFTLKSTSLF